MPVVVCNALQQELAHSERCVLVLLPTLRDPDGELQHHLQLGLKLAAVQCSKGTAPAAATARAWQILQMPMLVRLLVGMTQV